MNIWGVIIKFCVVLIMKNHEEGQNWEKKMVGGGEGGEEGRKEVASRTRISNAMYLFLDIQITVILRL